MSIIPDAFTTGFEEHMSTFSQEVRALNPVRIVVAGCGLCQFRMLWLEPWEGHLWFELMTSLLIPPFLRYNFV